MNLKNKSILAVSIVSLILVLSLVVVLSESRASNSVNDQLTRVACLGDSITNMTGYPADLQTLLGKNSTVGNFGFNGAAVNFYSDRTYFFSDSYRYARNFQPTTVIIMLGTNDARNNLDGQINNFTSNYEFMLEHIINGTKPFSGQPHIFLVIPPPIFENNLNLTSTIYTQEIIPRIEQVANSTGLPLIDVYTPLVNHSEYFPDGVHPNSVGAQTIANAVYTAITSPK